MAMTIARSRARMELREAQRRWTYGGRTDETRGGLLCLLSCGLLDVLVCFLSSGLLDVLVCLLSRALLDVACGVLAGVCTA